MKTLSNEHITIQVSEHGAELTSIKKCGREYLWQADPEFWARHAPVLFPFVGGVWNKEYRHDGNNYPMSQHGFARDKDFGIVDDQSSALTFRMEADEETLKAYPFHFRLDIGYRLSGNTITVTWDVANTGHDTMYFQIGAHPAFLYPNYAADCDERGYFGFEPACQLNRTPLRDGYAETGVRLPLRTDKDGMMQITRTTFDEPDTLILEDAQVKSVTLYTLWRKPWLTLRFDAPVVGLWSPPGKNAPFVCIELWYGRCDRVGFYGDLKQRDWTQQLQPAETFHAEYQIIIH